MLGLGGGLRSGEGGSPSDRVGVQECHIIVIIIMKICSNKLVSGVCTLSNNSKNT